MTFTYAKTMSLRPLKERRLSTFLIALGVAAGIFLPYMILSEGYFIFYGDFNVQQIPFYQMCHAAIRDGNIGWSWLTDLGSNFIGSYSFYLLGSPFFWLTLPFPNAWVPYLMGPLLILKFACAALTGYLYIRRFTRTPMAAQLGALMYAFSGFSVYNIFFNHFHEAIVFFPLLLLSLELLVTENRRGVFLLTVCLCAISNYFFFFGMVVFTVIYFFVRVFSGAIRPRFSRYIVIGVEAILGLALAAVLLIPSYLAIADNNRISSILLGWSAIMYGKEQIYLNIIECFFFPPDLPARPVFFPGAQVKWSSLGGWLPLFSMTGIFTWFISKKKTWIKRVIAISIFMALVPILNSAFYAFNTSYYARWFYMPILIMCLATSILTEDVSVDWGAGFRWCVGVTAAFALTIGFFPQKNDEDKLIFGLYSQSDDGMYIARFWVAVLIAAVSLILLGILLKLRKKNRTVFFNGAVIGICILSLIYANVFVAMGRSHSYEIKDVMIDDLIEGRVDLGDGEDFRIDVYSGVDNTSMYLGYSGINAFHSVVPPSIMEFYEYIGEERSVGSRPSTDVAAIRPLLSVKYLLNRADGENFIDDEGVAAMSGYKYLRTEGGYYIYKNENYIPYGFSYDYYMTKEFCDEYSESTRSELMLKAILLDDEQIKKYSHILDNIEDTRSNGYFSDTVRLSFSDEEMALDAERLKQTAAESFDITNTGFSAKVTREKDSLVFFSVPYDKGWSATVNGERVEIERVNVGFMAVLVGKGESEIVFTYETSGLNTGIMITLVTAVIAFVYILIASIYTSRHPDDTFYPEGDSLIEKWRGDAISEQLALRVAEDDDAFDNLFNKGDDDIDIPNLNDGFEGGFKVDTSVFDKDD